MKPFLRLFITIVSFLTVQFTNAQYCTPTLTTTGIYIGLAGFGPPYGNIPGGSFYDTGPTFASEGYANRSATSSGTVYRNCANNYSYNLQSCGNQGAKSFNFRIYADWNQDNDFDDANELAVEVSNSMVNGNCAFYSSPISITVPLTANGGNIRMRWALREGGGAATACGGYTGEIEDYTIFVAANTAPVLNNSGTPVLNSLVETQTTNDGMPVNRFILTTQPSVVLITETDACSYEKGIAITATTGANGTWQYKTVSGSWTNMGTVSDANALLLRETDRIRFVPSTNGTSGFSFRAWDRTISSNGQFYNIAGTGGITAFSSSTETNSLITYSTAAAAADIPVYMPAYAGGAMNVVTTYFSPSSGIFKHPTAITTDNSTGQGIDIVLDEINGKIYWLGGASGVDLMRSNTNGSNVEDLISGVFSYPTGLAIGGNKLFIADYGTALYTANLDGTGLTAITGGAGQATDMGDLADLAYYNGKIYYFNQPGYAGGFKIFQADADGTNTVELLTLANYPSYLDVVNDNLYWTESDGIDGYVKTRAVIGGSVSALLTEPGRSPLGLVASPGNNKIYFTDADQTGTMPYLNSIPITGGTVTRELVLEFGRNALVFNRSLAALPVHFISVKAWPKDKENIVEWTIAAEDHVDRYVVERSADGNGFSGTGSVLAENKSHYQWSDALPLQGANYYRIKSVDIDGKTMYSQTTLVNRDDKSRKIAVYPTAISNQQFTLQIQDRQSGAYQLQVINSTGQLIYARQINHNGGNSAQTVTLPATMAKGMYHVVIKGTANNYTAGIFIQ